MKISNQTFSEKEIEDLEIYGDNQKNGRLRMRYVVLLMTAQGISLVSAVCCRRT